MTFSEVIYLECEPTRKLIPPVIANLIITLYEKKFNFSIILSNGTPSPIW